MIARGARTLILWGPYILARHGDQDSRDGQPLSRTVFRTDIEPSTVETIIGNLRWSDPEFPVTVIE